MFVVVLSNPKARCQFSCPVSRVSGTNRKQVVMPDIGLRAVQGHSTRRDIGLGYLIAAQSSLKAYQEDLHCLCVHGTDPAAWNSIKESHSLIPGGLAGNRAAVHFAVSLPGDHGRMVSGFRTNYIIYMFFKLRWQGCLSLCQ